jgi:hypothetical protein
VIPERRQVLFVAASLSVFWVLTLIVAAGSRGDVATIVFVVAKLVFFFFTLPSLLFAYVNQWLAFAGILAGIALVVDIGIVFFWFLA